MFRPKVLAIILWIILLTMTKVKVCWDYHSRCCSMVAINGGGHESMLISLQDPLSKNLFVRSAQSLEKILWSIGLTFHLSFNRDLIPLLLSWWWRNATTETLVTLFDNVWFQTVKTASHFTLLTQVSKYKCYKSQNIKVYMSQNIKFCMFQNIKFDKSHNVKFPMSINRYKIW